MPDILTYRATIYPCHCDHMGHINVMWYALLAFV
jgi:acyl-CoA thioester hydrolase